MTVIVGLVTPDGAWMGSDSAAVSGEHFSGTSSPKVYRIGNALVGHAGEFGACQAAIKWWQETDKPSAQKFATEFRPRERKCSLLVIEKGRLYEIDEGRGVLKARKSKGTAFAAIGSGWLPAMGSLFASHNGPDAVLVALKASARYSTTVVAPFRILEA